MRYQYVFFDMDGTVLDTLRDLTDATNHILVEFGYAPVDADTIAHSLGNGAAHLIKRALTVSGGEEPDEALLEKALAAYKPYYNAHSRIRTAPYPGIIELMQTLKKSGVRMAVVSNKPDQTVQELSALFFRDLLEVSIGESSGIRKKPAPDTVFEAMRIMGLPQDPGIISAGDTPLAATDSNAGKTGGSRSESRFGGFSKKLLSKCVYIGDTEVDLTTAENSGMDCIAVDWGFRGREELIAAGAKTIVSSAEELLRAL